MNTNRKVFRNSSPTSGAELRCVFSGDSDYFSSSLFRFEAKYAEELKPSYISHRPCECFKAIPGVHLFNEDDIILPNQLVRNFEMKVPPLVSHFLVSFSHQYSSLSPSVRAFGPTRQPLLSQHQDILRFLKEARVFYLNAIRTSKERLAADIYSYYLANFRQGLDRDILTREAHIPFAHRCSADGYCLYVTFNRARETKLKSAYISDKKVFAIKPPACLFQSEAIISIPSFKAGKARLIAILNSAEETLISSVQSFKHFLENLRAYFLVFWKGCL